MVSSNLHSQMPRLRLGVSVAFFCAAQAVVIFIIYLSQSPVSKHTIIPFNKIENHVTSEALELAPYHTFIKQLSWIVEYSKNTTTLSTGRKVRIYYDRKTIYHETSPKGCRYKCLFPYSLQELQSGDASVFSANFDPSEIRALKKRGIVVAFEESESPAHGCHLGPEQLDLVDMFITYRTISPVPWMYESFIRNSNPLYQFTKAEKAKLKAKNSTYLLPPFHKNRSKLIAWVVSNMNPRNSRKEFAEAISAFIPVDVYGHGGNLKLPENGNIFEWLSKKYKFYLAFENSNCRDYITEKVYVNALSNNMVPIVLGAYKEDYEGALPPNSYINVDDYASIEQLTDYLLYLDRNDTAYASYFAWKEVGRVIRINRPDCRLCGYLYNLNAGKINLTKPNPKEYFGADQLCFQRPLLPKNYPSLLQS